jgi:hypothetical protein
MTPPPAPSNPSKLYETGRAVLGYAIGLWPLTGVVLLTFGLLWLVQLSHG